MMSGVRSQRDLDVILHVNFGPPSTQFTPGKKRSMVSDALFAKTGRRHALSTLFLGDEVQALMLLGDDKALITSMESLRRDWSGKFEQHDRSRAVKPDACPHIKVKTYPWDALQCKSLVPVPLHADEAI